MLFTRSSKIYCVKSTVTNSQKNGGKPLNKSISFVTPEQQHYYYKSYSTQSDNLPKAAKASGLARLDQISMPKNLFYLGGEFEKELQTDKGKVVRNAKIWSDPNAVLELPPQNLPINAYDAYQKRLDAALKKTQNIEEYFNSQPFRIFLGGTKPKTVAELITTVSNNSKLPPWYVMEWMSHALPADMATKASKLPTSDKDDEKLAALEKEVTPKDIWVKRLFNGEQQDIISKAMKENTDGFDIEKEWETFSAEFDKTEKKDDEFIL